MALSQMMSFQTMLVMADCSGEPDSNYSSSSHDAALQQQPQDEQVLVHSTLR